MCHQNLLAFERQTMGLLDDPVLLAELDAYTMERLPSGSWRYGAPSGLHDDCVMALALAHWAVESAPSIQNAHRINPHHKDSSTRRRPYER